MEKVKLLSEDIIDQEGWIEGSHTGNNRHFKDEYEDDVEFLIAKPILLSLIFLWGLRETDDSWGRQCRAGWESSFLVMPKRAIGWSGAMSRSILVHSRRYQQYFRTLGSETFESDLICKHLYIFWNLYFSERRWKDTLEDHRNIDPHKTFGGGVVICATPGILDQWQNIGRDGRTKHGLPGTIMPAYTGSPVVESRVGKVILHHKQSVEAGVF